MEEIRRGTAADIDGVWEVLEPIIKAGDTLVHAPDSTKEKIIDLYFADDKFLYVAEHEDKVVGVFYIKANQPDLGSHVANAGYMVHQNYRGYGLAEKMCRFSLVEAKNLGFRAMQFNIVVSTNEVAIRIWKKCGFEILAILPKVFQHSKLGLTDAFVMFQEL